MIRFWICPQKREIRFLDSEIRIWIFPRKRTLSNLEKVHPQRGLFLTPRASARLHKTPVTTTGIRACTRNLSGLR